MNFVPQLRTHIHVPCHYYNKVALLTRVSINRIQTYNDLSEEEAILMNRRVLMDCLRSALIFLLHGAMFVNPSCFI